MVFGKLGDFTTLAALASVLTACTMANPDFNPLLGDGTTETETETEAETTDEPFCNVPYMYSLEFIVGGAPCAGAPTSFWLEVEGPDSFNTPEPGLATGVLCDGACSECNGPQVTIGAIGLDVLVEAFEAQADIPDVSSCLEVFPTHLLWQDDDVCAFGGLYIEEYESNDAVFIGQRNQAPLPQGAQDFFDAIDTPLPDLGQDPTGTCDCELYYGGDSNQISCCQNTDVFTPISVMSTFQGKSYEPGSDEPDIHAVELGDEMWDFQVTKASRAPTCDNPMGEEFLSWALVRR